MTIIASAAAMGATALSSLLGTGIAAGVGTGALGLSAGAIAATGSTIGGALGGAALGAGLGAGTAALTGGDIGKGALMGAGTGALGGGVAGGISGAGGAGAVAAGEAGSTGATSATTAPLNAVGNSATSPIATTPFGTNLPGAIPPIDVAGSAGAGMPATTFPLEGIGASSATPLSMATPVGANSTGIIGANVPTSIPVSENLGALGYGGIKGGSSLTGSLPTGSLGSAGQQGIVAKAPGFIEKGMNLITKHPGTAMQVAGLGLGMLGSPQQRAEEQQLQSTNVPDYTSDNFQRYQATPYYAEGGEVQAPQGPMNPIVAKAMAAQQAQMQQQAPQPAPIQPVQPVQPMQPVQAAPIQPTPQPTPQVAPQQGIAQPQRPVGMASGGITDGYNLGGYAHGGNPRLLKGPGSGISDQIPATIGEDGKQPARLATGEFVVPARIVSELGSGDTDAGGKVLQQMVDRIQARRSKTVGKGKVAVDSKAVKDLPA